MIHKYLLLIMVLGVAFFVLGAVFVIHVDLRDSDGDTLMDSTNDAVRIICVAGC